MHKRIPLEQISSDLLRYGKTCPKNHHQPDGTNVRYKSTGHCVGCYNRLPEGQFTHQFTGEIGRAHASKYATPEDSRLAHIERVKAYQKRNLDKLRGWQATYNSKPEIIELNRRRATEAYQTMKVAYFKTDRTPEEEILAQQYLRKQEYQRNYDGKRKTQETDND